jgi:predicted  nucleic acid-binding Zn-ribbon protein
MEKEDFLRLLPKLIVEDNEVKGAIITALSGVMATKHDIERVIEHSDKRFEKMDERFERMDERFEKMDGRIEKLQEILISHTQALTQLNKRTNNLNANFSRIENIRTTEFKTLDGKIESLSEGQDIIKEHIKEIKEIVSKKE